MKASIFHLVLLIFMFIAVSIVYFEIYPQYHEWCIRWVYIGIVADLADEIRRMVIHYRKKE